MSDTSKERNPYFKIENDKEILTYINKQGEPIWFYMRRFILELLDEKTVGKYVINDTRDKSVSKILKYLIRSSIHNISMFFRNKNSKVIFYSVYQPIYENGLYINKYTEFYTDAVNDSVLTIETPPLDWKWEHKRRNNNVVFSCLSILMSEIKARLHKANSKDRKTVGSLMDYACDKVQNHLRVELSDEEKNRIIRETIKAMERAHLHSKWIVKQCKRRNAKCLIMIGASYLWNSAIVRELKGNGIKVADLQHGFIFKDNLVYDTSRVLSDIDELKASTPDYFMSYGKWWNDQTNLPYSEKVALGNPYRDKKMLSYKNSDNRNVIVIIGTGVNTDEHYQLAIRLREIVPQEYEVVFRPHPTERVYARTKYTESVNVEIDCDHELYDMLARTKVLISKSSTVLFEAHGLVDRILVWNDFPGQMFFEGDFFEHFDSYEELVEILREPSVLPTDINFWEDNCINNFIQFYQGL